MNILVVIAKFAAGLTVGAGVPIALLWLWFVYPYTQVSLKAVWIGGAVGLVVALVIVGYFVVLMAAMWGAD